ncbi:unnamed protein product [Cuscuta epithymum]|uniref:CASP-like protein n=1 Tax=Cuscuta epithymum TaxID=186058 RepID=A0AAV0FRR2_9ASTE|nr:unnamed protein product [Cuscuta epithymum]CAH9138344.1 unnamed protein product [Cuscuta epithymum]
MKQMFGGPGKISGLILRSLQGTFAAIALGILSFVPGVGTNTPFCFLLVQQCVQIIWCFILICLDLKVLVSGGRLPSPIHMMVNVAFDWCIWMLSLGAASSAASVVEFFRATSICENWPEYTCRRYQAAVVMAFIVVALQAISVHIWMWIAASSFLPMLH